MASGFENVDEIGLKREQKRQFDDFSSRILDFEPIDETVRIKDKGALDQKHLGMIDQTGMELGDPVSADGLMDKVGIGETPGVLAKVPGIVQEETVAWIGGSLRSALGIEDGVAEVIFERDQDKTYLTPSAT